MEFETLRNFYFGQKFLRHFVNASQTQTTEGPGKRKSLSCRLEYLRGHTFPLSISQVKVSPMGLTIKEDLAAFLDIVSPVLIIGYRGRPAGGHQSL